MGEAAEDAVTENQTGGFVGMLAGRANQTENLRARLRQDTVWVDAEGVERLVAEMRPRHAANVVRFIERRARWLHDGACAETLFWAEPNGEQAGYAFQDEIDRLFEFTSDPVRWVREQPLMRALCERAGETAPGPEARWLLRHPVYAVRYLVRRLPVAA